MLRSARLMYHDFAKLVNTEGSKTFAPNSIMFSAL